jgi:hypothetical protein
MQMYTSGTFVSGAAVIALSALFVVGTVGSGDAAVSKLEQKCASKLGKSSAKLSSTSVKLLAKCRDNDISGKLVGACPDASATGKINKASTKLLGAAEKSCGSNCGVTSSLSCLSNALCPPNGVAPESCDGDNQGGEPFGMANIGFPGAFCESVVLGPITTKSELATCVDTVARDGGDVLIDLVYGSVVNATGISNDAAKCLASIAKVSGKLASTIVKGVSKCRDSINKGKVLGDPIECTTDDAKLAAKIAKTDVKLRDTIASKCTDAQILELDLCDAGVGAIADVSTAQDCVSDAINELADSALLPANRTYSSASMIEAAYPPQPICGDDVVNQGPTTILPVGEECDGPDDTACPGACAPPGDVFECTCTTIPRARLFANYFGNTFTDTDAGWTGLSHNQKIAENSGYTTTLENCQCDGFTDASCTGGSSDPVCDAFGAELPVCSWEPGSATRCDDRGNTDDADTDSDCWICDASAINAGATCASGLDCQSQCFDTGGSPTGACSAQSDCAAGEICRGRCDKEQTCLLTYDGAPLAVNTAGTAVCTVQVYKEPVTGTRNIVTGEHELNYLLLSRVHLAEANNRPCPVCGGFCVGGKYDLRVCQGRCSISDDPCRFDTDCPGGETCLEASPDCPNGSCELSLVCGAIEAENPGLTGTPCAITYNDPVYGSISKDCLPFVGKKINGDGFEVLHAPTTSQAISLPSSLPCTSPGFELLGCPCPDDGGNPTQPNTCAPACDAGPDFGIGCAIGNSSGLGTSCAAGVNAGKLCDEDADCPASSCSANPTHCKGDPAFERFTCTTNGDCGVGTCEDACPGGRCLPLCLPNPGDPDDGLCADGPAAYSCSGVLHQSIACTEAAANGSCSATCSTSGGPCTTIGDCPPGEACEGECELQQFCEAGADGDMGTDDDGVGAGACIATSRDCFLDPIPAEGGTTLNGKGDHTDWNSVGLYCFPNGGSAVINEGAGFGGPGRTRRKGTTVVNVTSIP